MTTIEEMKKEAFWVRCKPCAHEWIAAYTPMEMGKFGKLMKGMRCPMCGGDSKTIFLKQQKATDTTSNRVSPH